jgi:hypothetical protein
MKFALSNVSLFWIRLVLNAGLLMDQVGKQKRGTSSAVLGAVAVKGGLTINSTKRLTPLCFFFRF